MGTSGDDLTTPVLMTKSKKLSIDEQEKIIALYFSKNSYEKISKILHRSILIKIKKKNSIKTLLIKDSPKILSARDERNILQKYVIKNRILLNLIESFPKECI